MTVLFDVSMNISQDIAVFPGDPKVYIENTASIKSGDSCNVSKLILGNHTGTHVDAPKHFYDDGITIDEMELDYFYGTVKVFEIMNKREIDVSDLTGLNIKKGDRIIFKTDNSKINENDNFYYNYSYINSDAARYLTSIGIKTLGIDYLSVEGYRIGSLTHLELLKNKIAIIEGLRLSEVNAGEYKLCAFPLKIKGGNGSPARVVLIAE